MEQSIRDLSIEEKKAQFRKAAITHRLLERTDRTIMRAIGEPAGFAFLLVHGPTGVGKTKMIEILTERIKGKQPSEHPLPFASWFHQTAVMQIPLLVVEARRMGAPLIAPTTIGRCFHSWENEPIRSRSISTFMPRPTPQNGEK